MMIIYKGVDSVFDSSRKRRRDGMPWADAFSYASFTVACEADVSEKREGKSRSPTLFDVKLIMMQSQDSKLQQ